MEQPVLELLRIIREEVGLYRDLIEHARRKTALLVHGSVTAILESNKVEETFNTKLRTLEDEMARLCRELSKVCGLSGEAFTLLKLAEGLDQPLADEIKRETGLFRNLIDQLKAVNQRNMRLIENSVRYSRGLLDFLAGASCPYQATGVFRPYPAVQTTISDRV
jgi:hypothetical protein